MWYVSLNTEIEEGLTLAVLNEPEDLGTTQKEDVKKKRYHQF